MINEPTENGQTEKKQQDFFELAGRLRDATGPEDVQRLGDQFGRMVFGG